MENSHVKSDHDFIYSTRGDCGWNPFFKDQNFIFKCMLRS